METKRPRKEILEKMYFEDEMLQNEIAEYYGVGPMTVHNWLKYYDIPRRSQSDAFHLARGQHIELNEDIMEFLDGDMLGDASFVGTNHAASISHTCKHERFMEWYLEIFSSLGIESPSGIKMRRGVTKGVPFVGYRVISRYYEEFKPILKRFYPNGIKIVPKDIRLTPTALLYWYLGDGGLWHLKRQSTRVQLCTDAFTVEDVKFLVGKLQNMGLSAAYNKSHNRIRINAKSTVDFLHLIGPCPDGVKDVYGHKWEPAFRSKKLRNEAIDKLPNCEKILSLSRAKFPEEKSRFNRTRHYSP